MVYLFAFIVVTACFSLFLHSKWLWMVKQARRKGLYPEKGKATMFHVRELIIEGEIDLAIRLYSEIFRINYTASKKAVEELERSIQEKQS